MTKILGIKDHSTRGKEVIEIFEMLGGKNYYKFAGNSDNVYYIRNDSSYNNIIDYWVGYYPIDFMIFTLEEFLEKFPYKVGDKVKCAKINDFTGRITNIRWDESEEQIIYVVEWDDASKSKLTYFAKGLQPYKEETFGECIEKTINECLFGSDEETMVKENYSPITLLPVLDKVMIIPTNEDSEIIEENGKFYLVKKQQKYPNTYEECCEVLSIAPYYKLRYHTFEHGYHELATSKKLGLLQDNLNTLGKLLICRDAYWKIAGEEMDLGKPWEPDWNSLDKKYNVYNYRGDIKYDYFTVIDRCLLVFPTVEMRDVFYNNFKELIEQCKELL